MRSVLVTGGGRGIGRAIALALAEPGTLVAIAARTRADLEDTAAAIENHGARPVPLAVDVTDEAAVAEAFERLRAASRHLDVLVNNAGLGGGTPIQSTDTASWRRILDTNVWGTFLVTRQAVPMLNDGGRIINVSSVLGRFGVPEYTAYCASKHAVIGFTRALALELVTRGVTVNGDLSRVGRHRHGDAGDAEGRERHGHQYRRISEAGDRRGADPSDHSAGRGREPGEVSRILARVGHHRRDLQHLRRSGDELAI